MFNRAGQDVPLDVLYVLLLLSFWLVGNCWLGNLAKSPDFLKIFVLPLPGLLDLPLERRLRYQ